jgi:hypothetical protein
MLKCVDPRLFTTPAASVFPDDSAVALPYPTISLAGRNNATISPSKWSDLVGKLCRRYLDLRSEARSGRLGVARFRSSTAELLRARQSTASSILRGVQPHGVFEAKHERFAQLGEDVALALRAGDQVGKARS